MPDERAVPLPAIGRRPGARVALDDTHDPQLPPDRAPVDARAQRPFVEQPDQVVERESAKDQVDQRDRPLARRQGGGVEADRVEVLLQRHQARRIVKADVAHFDVAHGEQDQAEVAGPAGAVEHAGQVIEQALGRAPDEEQVAIGRGRDDARAAAAQVGAELRIRLLRFGVGEPPEALAAGDVPPERNDG
jgi:hypothetical protein